VIMTREKKIFQPVPSKGVYLAYGLLLQDNLVSFPLTEEGKHKIESLISNINNTHFGERVYKTTEEKVVAYLYFIIKDHPFIDGNKRTGSLVFEVACKLNNLKPNYEKFTLDSMAVFIEKIQENDHQNVIKMLASLLFYRGV
jgi:prophage maintenance system killer protein